MKKVLIIYSKKEITDEFVVEAKKLFECDIVFQFEPGNTLGNIQYPYFETKLINW